MGNEVDGVADEVIALADGVIEIPQFGTKHSFNVSVTIGIVAWEFVKKIRLVQNENSNCWIDVINYFSIV